MIIDTHQHVFWQGKNDAALIADLDSFGIDRAWLLTAENRRFPLEVETFGGAGANPLHAREDGSHPGLALADILVARDRHPSRLVAGYCPDPQLANAPALFEAAVTMHGVRVCGEWKFRMPFDDPRCLELFKAAGRAGAPVVLHLDVAYLPDADGKPIYQPRWYGGNVTNLENALIACPQTTFIGHAPGFWREISGDADRDPAQYPAGPLIPGGKVHALLERYPNLDADLSAGSGLRALKRDPAHAVEFLSRFADKLLFGRDGFGGDLMEFLNSLQLSAEVSDKLFGGNAARLVDAGLTG